MGEYGWIWSFVLPGAGMLSSYLITRKKIIGWEVGNLTNLAWVVYASTTAQWGFLISALLYIGINTKACREWSKDERESGQGNTSVSVWLFGWGRRALRLRPRRMPTDRPMGYPGREHATKGQ